MQSMDFCSWLSMYPVWWRVCKVFEYMGYIRQYIMHHTLFGITCIYSCVWCFVTYISNNLYVWHIYLYPSWISQMSANISCWHNEHIIYLLSFWNTSSQLIYLVTFFFGWGRPLMSPLILRIHCRIILAFCGPSTFHLFISVHEISRHHISAHFTPVWRRCSNSWSQWQKLDMTYMSA